LAKINPTEDSDFTRESFEQVYQADLANGLGNLVARVAKLAELQRIESESPNHLEFDTFIGKAVSQYRFDSAMEEIWKKISQTDITINQKELWKNTSQKTDVLKGVIREIRQIAYNPRPFLPQTADKIEKQFTGPAIKSEKVLFPRLM
jgi:methionyl-tRNA synthetase